jgi:hypothetical protein
MRNNSAENHAAVGAEIEASKPTGNGIVVGGLSPLSETLWRDKAATEFVGDVSARLTWKDLTVMVTLSNGETQKVLEGLTGYAEPGSITALMGPSGSGKSTLLDALSSRLAANAFLSGTILLNGRKTKLSFGTAVSFSSFFRGDIFKFIYFLIIFGLVFFLVYIYMCPNIFEFY